MPRVKRDRSRSYEDSRNSALTCSSSCTGQPTPTYVPETQEDQKEWEEARCPVCMEHPHNAVLLICSSYNKGCHPYMCDTSYRHSNCLDQFRKSFSEISSVTLSSQDGTQNPAQPSNAVTVESVIVGSQEDSKIQGPLTEPDFSSMHKLQQKLVCPLCRGEISGWIVVESARHFMNTKSRTCACETCDFSGSYTDLRKHARLEHPQARPSEADPERQRNWRRLERQRDIGDVLSTIQSSLGEEREDDWYLPPIEDGGWLTIFFLIRFVRSEPSARARSNSWSGASRARTRVHLGARRRRSSRLWGETYEGEPGSAPMDENYESSDGGLGTWTRRVRRRLSSPDNDI